MLTKGLAKVSTFVTKLLNFNLHEALILMFPSYCPSFDTHYIVRYSLNASQDRDEPRLKKVSIFCIPHTITVYNWGLCGYLVRFFSWLVWNPYPCVLSELQKIHMSVSVLPDRVRAWVCAASPSYWALLSTAYKQTFLEIWRELLILFSPVICLFPWSLQFKLFMQTERAIVAEHLSWTSKCFWKWTVCCLSHRNNFFKNSWEILLSQHTLSHFMRWFWACIVSKNGALWSLTPYLEV